MNLDSNKNILLRTPRFDVIKETIGEKDFYYVSKPNAVAILVVKSNKVGLVKIHRNLIKDNHFEIIGGRIESEETPLVTAKRELKEEIGITSEKWSHINTLYPLPSVVTEKVYIFKAEVNKEVVSKYLQVEEGLIDFNFYSKKEISEMISNKQIINAVDGFALMSFLQQT